MAVIKASNSAELMQNNDTMRYRNLGSTGLKVSALSMGCMRLGEDQEINTAAISKAIDLGINYFETTRGYCQGQCQQRTAPGLKDRTEGVIVSGKASISADTTAHSFRKEMELQLEILGLTHFKFFQVGWFGWDRIGHLLKRGGVLDALRMAQDEGLVHHVGFTGHDKPENFTRIIETGIFDSLTVPYNLINRSYEGTIARAGELGVGVVAMCPVAGGVLAGESKMLQETLGMEMPTTAMALRFVLSNPNVSTACSGMTTPAMVEENVNAVKDFDPEKADFEEICAGLDKLRERFGDKICTSCRYCMPCPQELNIPHLMGLYRDWKAFDLDNAIIAERVRQMPENAQPKKCTACGLCIKRCPNDLAVPEQLHELAGLGKYDENR